MRRRTVEADTPRYAAASPTENSGLENNPATSAAAGGRSPDVLVVVRDVDTGPPSGEADTISHFTARSRAVDDNDKGET